MTQVQSTDAGHGPRFETLGLNPLLLKALAAEGYLTPTPIQLQAIPHVAEGRDLLGCAQTGTGKTAAFALPILQRLMQGRDQGQRQKLRALVLSPTRELASQIHASFTTYGRFTGLTSTVVFGGVGQNPQVRRLRAGVDILVATPGRLLDLMNQGAVRFDGLEILVLDEADRMLDMGFVRDVRKIVAALPAKRQSLLFSATMPRDIENLAASLLHDPVHVAVTPVASTAERIEQRVFFVGRTDKRALLEHLLADTAMGRVLVFARTKHGANRLAEQLDRAGIRSDAIHGNKSQSAREQALASFKAGRSRVLVATDIAARGIDVDGVTHVVNFELPDVPESYVHRIGRTARAGSEGIALSFCDRDERGLLNQIERLTHQQIPVVSDHPFPLANAGRGPAGEQRRDGGRGPGRSGNPPQRNRRSRQGSSRARAA